MLPGNQRERITESGVFKIGVLNIEYQNNEFGVGVIGKVVNITADEGVMVDGKLDISLVDAIAFDPYTHGYYRVTERVGEAFSDGLQLK